MRTLVLGLTALALAFPAAAEVVQADERGFVTRDEAVLRSHPDDIWQALVQPSEWWNGAHSWSGDASNLSLSAQAGGCFCESLPGGGSVEHMRVVYAEPGRLLRMAGSLGPLQSEALTGTLTISLEAIDGATRIEWTYVLGGYSRYPLDQIAPAVDAVQSEQLSRLHALIWMGDPDWQPGQNRSSQ